MSRQPTPVEPERRGPGRPPVDPSGETQRITVRIGPRHAARLREIVEEGHGPTLADAVRWLIEQS